MYAVQRLGLNAWKLLLSFLVFSCCFGRLRFYQQCLCMPLHWRATCDGTAKSLWCSLAGLCSGIASKLVGLGEPAMPICRSKATFGLDFCRLCRAGMGSAHTTSLLRCVQSAVVLGSLCTVSSRVVLRTWAQTFLLVVAPASALGQRGHSRIG